MTDSQASATAAGQSLYRAPTADLESRAVVYCRHCGAQIDAQATKCSSCHSKQLVGKARSKTTAALLAFFLGGLGIHRLYLGQWWGILYFLFWGTLIPSVISLIESIVFAATSRENWQRKYGNVHTSGTTIAIVVVVGIFVGIAMLGILAAIALPAYQEYTIRSKVMSAMPLVHDTQSQVAAFIQRTNFYPNQNIDAGLPENISSDVVESLVIGENGRMHVTYRSNVLKQTGRTLEWVPVNSSGSIGWQCVGGSMAEKYQPRECRDGGATHRDSTEP